MNPEDEEDPEEILETDELLEGEEEDEGVILKLLVPNNMVGSIIGKGGDTIKDITAQTSAKIHIAQGDEVSPERMVTITGNLANVSRAQFQISYKMLEEAFAELKNLESPKPLEQRISLLPLKLIIPNSVVGRLIGKGGTNLKRTMAETDTFITCSKEEEFPRFIGERVVSIIGSVENQNRAQVAIIQQIKQYTLAQPTGPPAQQQQQQQQQQQPLNGSPPLHKASSPLVYDHGYATAGVGMLRTPPHGAYAAYAPRGMVPIAAYAPPVSGIPFRLPSELQDQEETLCVQVPNGVIGSIIGKKGMTVRDISTRSGCNVRVARNNEVDINAAYRPITLIGSIDSLFKAQSLLFSKIVEAPPAVGGGADQLLRVDITIPNEVVGRVIGKKGSQVKKITEMSGARITINQDEEGEAIGTLVSIVGTLESNLYAQSRIFEILSYHSSSE